MRALIVVDMSVEQYANINYRKQALIENICQLTDLPWATKLDSRLWFDGSMESTLSLSFPECGTGLGKAGSKGAALVPELEKRALQFVEKKHFSSFVDCDLESKLKALGVDEVYIAGINTDFCIFLTALDSFARGRFKTYVVVDAVSSLNGENGHIDGLRRLQSHLPPKSLVTTAQVVSRLSCE